MAEGTRSLDAVNEDDDKEMRVVLVGEECRQNTELVDAVKKLDCERFESETGYEYIPDASEYDLIFVLSEFRGEVFDKLHKADVRIVGPPVIMRCARDNLPIPYNSRPQYCFSMQGLKVCFTGFKEKADLCHFVDLVHYMAGNVRRDFKSNVTHLVANVIGGEKYEVGCDFDLSDFMRQVVDTVQEERLAMRLFQESSRYRGWKFLRCFECLTPNKRPVLVLPRNEGFVCNGGIHWAR